MNFVSFDNGDIAIEINKQQSVNYPRVTANQLIKCARMNDWSSFLRMWEKKTDPEAWTQIHGLISKLDTKAQWNIKEGMARFATMENEALVEQPSIVKTVTVL